MITPVDTGKATQFSEARVVLMMKTYTSLSFSLTIQLKESYVVESLKRDFSFGKNDNFLVAIDPFNNQNTGFAFGLNAYGAQWDGTMYQWKKC